MFFDVSNCIFFRFIRVTEREDGVWMKASTRNTLCWNYTKDYTRRDLAPEQGNSVIKYLFFARALHLQGFATNNSIELQLGAHNKTFVKKICEIFRSVFTLWYRRLLRYWRERIRIPKVPPPPTTRTTILIKLGAPRHFFPLLSHSPPKGFFKIGIFCSRHHSTDVKRLLYRGKILAKKIHHFKNPRKIMPPARCACKIIWKSKCVNL